MPAFSQLTDLMNLTTPSPLDHPLLSARYFFPFAAGYADPLFVEGEGFRLGCRYR
jgi:hypothetical protein